MATILGSQVELISQSSERVPTGVITIQEYQGSQMALQAVIAALGSWQEWQLQCEAGLWRLTVRSPDNLAGDASETFQWEMPGEDLEKDLLEHQRSLAISQADIETIRLALKNPSPSSRPALTGDASRLYLLMLRGTDHYLAPAYALQLRRTVGSRYARNVSDEHVLKIYSAAQLQAEALVAGTPLPDRLAYKIDHLPPVRPPTDEVLEYQWGWLKKPSTEIQTAKRRMEITTEWTLELWSRYIYESR